MRTWHYLQRMCLFRFSSKSYPINKRIFSIIVGPWIKILCIMDIIEYNWTNTILLYLAYENFCILILTLFEIVFKFILNLYINSISPLIILFFFIIHNIKKIFDCFLSSFVFPNPHILITSVYKIKILFSIFL